MLVAAGIAFFSLLAFVPALAALVAIYGLVFDPSQVVTQVGSVSHLLPGDVSGLLQEQLVRLTTQPEQKLGATALIALAITLFSASSATKGLIEGLNIVYAEKEKRSWLHLTLFAIALTVAGIVSVVVFLASTVFLPKALELFGITQVLPLLIVSYVTLAFLLWFELTILYRWAPSRDTAKLRWIAPGSLVAVALLVLFSWAFSWFVRTFAAYSAYGSLGVVIAFMTWLWVSMVIILVGAQLNAESEHQTIRDSTEGIPAPMGFRGAVMADTVGRSADSRLPPDVAIAVPIPAIRPAPALALLLVAGALLLVSRKANRFHQ